MEALKWRKCFLRQSELLAQSLEAVSSLCTVVLKLALDLTNGYELLSKEADHEDEVAALVGQHL